MGQTGQVALTCIQERVQNTVGAAAQQRELNSVLCDDLEGGIRGMWEGGLKRGYIYTFSSFTLSSREKNTLFRTIDFCPIFFFLMVKRELKKRQEIEMRFAHHSTSYHILIL